MQALSEIFEAISALDEDEVRDLAEKAQQLNGNKLWIPNPGPQTDAYLSDADVMLYGGSAGGGKTHLELGWGVNDAESGIIFRREGTQTDGLEKEGKLIIGANARFNGQDLEWTWPGAKKSLKLAGMPQIDDWQKHAGRERDYYAFDEAGEFIEAQVASIIAWERTDPGKRTRVILGSNPPRTSEGLWMMKWFSPWLDDMHTYPAIPGELRWAVHVSKADEIEVVWVEGPGRYEIEGEEYIAKSYTFIPASLHDNPYRDTPEYRARLQSLPEPLRSQLLYGKFTSGLKDAANQMIPTAWVRAAFDRWDEKLPDLPMCAMGVDCSGGGEDPMVIANRYDGWYAPLIKVPGADIPQERAGSYAAGVVMSHRRNNAKVVVDMGGGYGGPLYEHLCENDIDCVAYKGAEKSALKSKEGKLPFTNTRTAAYWRFREALDPDQPGGSPIAMKKDNRLLAGLTAVTFEVTPQGIKAEPKVKYDKNGKVNGGVKSKLGFSPDEADAVVQAWFHGDKMSNKALDWIKTSQLQKTTTGGRQPLSARRRR